MDFIIVMFPIVFLGIFGGAIYMAIKGVKEGKTPDEYEPFTSNYSNMEGVINLDLDLGIGNLGSAKWKQ